MQSMPTTTTNQIQYPFLRVIGVWLMLIGFVIAIATLFGGTWQLNPILFMVGYGISLYLTEFHPYVKKNYSLPGELRPFQKKMSKYGDISLFPLVFILGGSFIPSGDYRMVWLGTLLATGIHFLLFIPVHGRSMLYLSLACMAVAISGMLLPATPFLYFGLLDGGIKMAFGLYLFSLRSS